MKFKDNSRLSGIHTSIIAYCDNDTCNADQIIWISEHFEKSLHIIPYEQAVAQLYEIGWEFFNVDDVTHVLCQECAILYHEELQSIMSKHTTVKLGDSQQLYIELGGLEQTEKQREDAFNTNCE